jgi:hypothetical protein
MANPLDGTSRFTIPHFNSYFLYYLQVVGTRAVLLDGTLVRSNQYAATFHEQKIYGSILQLPGLYIHYDISPLLITYTQTKRTLAQFLTAVCGLVGGILTMAKLLDAFVYRAEKQLRQKREMGKLQ